MRFASIMHANLGILLAGASSRSYNYLDLDKVIKVMLENPTATDIYAGFIGDSAPGCKLVIDRKIINPITDWGYQASTWAQPALHIDFPRKASIVVPCYTTEDRDYFNHKFTWTKAQLAAFKKAGFGIG